MFMFVKCNGILFLWYIERVDDLCVFDFVFILDVFGSIEWVWFDVWRFVVGVVGLVNVLFVGIYVVVIKFGVDFRIEFGFNDG